MDGKRLTYGVLGVGLLIGAYFIWKKGEADVEATKSEPTPGVPNVPAKPVTPPSKDGKTTTIPESKTVSADELLKQGEKAILNKTLVAKADGLGIYDTVLKKVGSTKKGVELGKAFKANPTSNGSYNIKYTDADGQYRIVNSVSVN